MNGILISWIGLTDIKASNFEDGVGLGPICQAAKINEYDEIVLISDLPAKVSKAYIKWLQANTESEITLQSVDLPGPTDFGAIYQAATRVIIDVKKRFRDKEYKLHYHLSPGTPAMAAVWILIAKTVHPAALIESSKKGGVKTATVPFNISSEFIPDLFREADEQLVELSSELPPETPHFGNIHYQSQIMHRVIEKARIIAPRSVPVLIEGESGTGKELLARAIHSGSQRKGKPFVSINCGAIPSELIESELFGHEKGAFTGAERLKKGYFEAATAGTLFLDELGELSLSAQVKLLRAIQENEITRVGSTKAIKIDVRIIAATNCNLTNEVYEGRFRSDLFFRIAVAVLKLPPLRDRKGDISLLIDRLLDDINYQSASEPGYIHKNFSPNAINIMLKHPWPGNVRELQNTLRRAAIWSQKSRIDTNDILDALLPLVKNDNDNLLGRPIDDGFNIHNLQAILTKHYIKRALIEANGNKTKAAKKLGIMNYQTLANWMKKYEIE
jgi:transcriptional regulator with PAS, ATPase and Fis domain